MACILCGVTDEDDCTDECVSRRNPSAYPIVIFDLDGTLCDDRHRAHHIEVESPDDETWQRYHAACIDDPPVVAAVLLSQMAFDSGHDVHILTGRDERNRAMTETWLAYNGVLAARVWMRPDGDRRRNPVYKHEVVQALLDAGCPVRLVVDDHPGVAEALDGLGVPVLTVRGFRDWSGRPVPTAG